MPTKPTTTPTHDPILAKLTELTERSKQLASDAEQLLATLELEQVTRLARGTKRDMQPLRQPAVQLPQPVPAIPSVQDSPLYAKIRELVTVRPLTLRELITQTNAEENKVKVVLLRMQRDGIGLENMGSRYRALWFIPSEAFRARMHKDRSDV